MTVVLGHSPERSQALGDQLEPQGHSCWDVVVLVVACVASLIRMANVLISVSEVPVWRRSTRTASVHQPLGVRIRDTGVDHHRLMRTVWCHRLSAHPRRTAMETGGRAVAVTGNSTADGWIPRLITPCRRPWPAIGVPLVAALAEPSVA